MLVREAMLSPQMYPSVHDLVGSIHVLLESLYGWQCTHVVEGRNKPVSDIAWSVIKKRLLSYIARGGSRWLQKCLTAEAMCRWYAVAEVISLPVLRPRLLQCFGCSIKYFLILLSLFSFCLYLGRSHPSLVRCFSLQSKHFSVKKTHHCDLYIYIYI